MNFLRGFGPAHPQMDLRAVLTSGLGAALLLAATVWLLPRGTGIAVPPALLAPLGASALMLAALPQSPQSQPWSVVLGTVLAAGAAELVLHLAPAALAQWAGLIALALATVLMAAARAIHAPAGILAMSLAGSGPASRVADTAYLLLQIGAAAALLVAMALVWHLLLGNRYPMKS